jgi:4'-phosphopantetheinyl transferase
VSLDHWRAPPIDLRLSHGEVHVWRAALDVPPAYLQSLERVLAAEEVYRAQRFRFERDRGCYVATRGTLRILLGRYLRTDPADVRLGYGKHGKPALAAQPGEGRLRFNVSHSGELALLAFARDREVGVDLEKMRPIPQMDQIAQRFFTAREYAALHKIGLDQRLGAFYCCWTRKEAYIKAKGEGLTIPLDSVDVGLRLGTHAGCGKARSWTVGDGGSLDGCSLWSLRPAPGYVGALAAEGTALSFRCWHVPRPCHKPRVQESISPARVALFS